ncbi:uncharacterized protein J3D65DRAFT_602864 [Phyllosticta citribraziliensis]|uniref:Retrotransposon gag domain-containing protein n=1 Tax=Phyllosticta citribraziliensis TaxID=989973 RepID=A0ABR1LS46_9PEZI
MSDTSYTSATKPSPPLDSSSESDFYSHGSDILTPSAGSSEPSGSRGHPHVCKEQERLQAYYSRAANAAAPAAGSSEPSELQRLRAFRRVERAQRRRDGRDESEGAERRPAAEIEKKRNGEQRLEARGRWRTRREEEKRRRDLDLVLLREDNVKLRKDVVELKEKVEALAEAATKPRTRFDPRDIGFYQKDFDYSSGNPISYTTGMDGRRLYRNVEFFIEAIANAAQKIPEQVLRDNLQHCLHGDAYTWYSSILTADQREELTKGDGLSNWIGLLRGKWGLTTEGVFQKLASLEITYDDIKMDHNFPAKYCSLRGANRAPYWDGDRLFAANIDVHAIGARDAGQGQATNRRRVG